MMLAQLKEAPAEPINKSAQEKPQTKRPEKQTPQKILVGAWAKKLIISTAQPAAQPSANNNAAQVNNNNATQAKQGPQQVKRLQPR